jgi:hypothetical protein
VGKTAADMARNRMILLALLRGLMMGHALLSISHSAGPDVVDADDNDDVVVSPTRGGCCRLELFDESDGEMKGGLFRRIRQSATSPIVSL